MLLNLDKQEKIQLKQLLRDGKVVQHYFDKAVMQHTKSHGWDGYIHPSYLNWKQKPEMQLKAHVEKGGRKDVTAHRRFRLGDVLHSDFMYLLSTEFPGHSEVAFEDKSILFHGTADYIGFHRLLGTVVFEFKSFGELQRDSTGGKRLWEKIERHLEQYFRRENASELNNKYHLFTDKDVTEIHSRLMTLERIRTGPDVEHLTQAFTYAMIANRLKQGVLNEGEEDEKVVEIPPIDRVCVCYINKEGYSTKEFWYKVSKHQDKLQLAKDNYKAVLKLLRGHHRANNSSPV